MKPKCEELSKIVIPSIRALVAELLIKKFNFTQIQVAKALKISQPAVSYYLRYKRGKKAIQAIRNCAAMSKIEELARKIAEGASEKEVRIMFCKVCQEVSKELNLKQI